MVAFTYRPIEQWPGALTSSRKSTPFRSSFDDTVKLLSAEVEALGAREAVIQLALKEGEVRRDGMIRANSRPSHPGVIVAFKSKKLGPLQFATDVFDGWWSGQVGWHANLRAVALGLEALRKVDRYGITRRGEQYTGWQALPPAFEMHAAMTVEEAARFIADEADYSDQSDVRDMDAFRKTLCDKLLAGSNPDLLSSAFRRAARRLHPDLGGDPAKFIRLKDAKTLLEQQVA